MEIRDVLFKLNARNRVQETLQIKIPDDSKHAPKHKDEREL